VSLPVSDGADPVQRVVDPGSVVLGEIAYLKRETHISNEQKKHLAIHRRIFCFDWDRGIAVECKLYC
jgi:hypothetical protein